MEHCKFFMCFNGGKNLKEIYAINFYLSSLKSTWSRLHLQLKQQLLFIRCADLMSFLDNKGKKNVVTMTIANVD